MSYEYISQILGLNLGISTPKRYMLAFKSNYKNKNKNESTIFLLQNR